MGMDVYMIVREADLYPCHKFTAYDTYRGCGIFMDFSLAVKHTEELARKYYFKEHPFKTVFTSYSSQSAALHQWLVFIVPDYVNCEDLLYAPDLDDLYGCGSFEERPEKVEHVLKEIQKRCGTMLFDYFVVKEEYVHYK